jgi:hypothetical protein
MIGPGLIEMLAQVPKEPHNIASSARISHLFYFPIGRVRAFLHPSFHLRMR